MGTKRIRLTGKQKVWMLRLRSGCRNGVPESEGEHFASIYKRLTSLPWLVELSRSHHYGGVTASTEVIAVKRHTGVHASEIACKNTIATPQMAYAA